MNWLFRLLDWYKQYRLDVIKAKSDIQNKPYEAMMEIVKAQSKFLQDWLDGFKVTEVPISTTIRDEDEYRMEQERERNKNLELDPGIKKSIENALKAGALPELRDILR